MRISLTDDEWGILLNSQLMYDGVPFYRIAKSPVGCIGKSTI